MIKEAYLYDLLKQYNKKDISFSRMVELLNQEAKTKWIPVGEKLPLDIEGIEQEEECLAENMIRQELAKITLVDEEKIIKILAQKFGVSPIMMTSRLTTLKIMV